MGEKLDRLLENQEAMNYFRRLPDYAQEAVMKHESQINDFDAMRLYAETFLEDDSYRGA